MERRHNRRGSLTFIFSPSENGRWQDYTVVNFDEGTGAKSLDDLMIPREEGQRFADFVEALPYGNGATKGIVESALSVVLNREEVPKANFDIKLHGSQGDVPARMYLGRTLTGDISLTIADHRDGSSDRHTAYLDMSELRHMVQNPAVNITSLVAQLRELTDDPALLDLIDQVDAQARSIGRILRAQKILKQPDELKPESVLLYDDVIADVLACNTPSIYQKRITVDQTHSLPSELRIITDRDVLHTIYEIHIENAIKYTEEGGRISFGAREVTMPNGMGGLELNVWNSGRGVAKSDLPHIYNPGYRGRRTQAISGTGVGLPVAKDATETLGGYTLPAESDGKSYTNLRWVLPLDLTKVINAPTQE